MSVLYDDGSDTQPEELQHGDYIVVNNVWGKYSLGTVPSYTQSITIDDTADLSSGIHMDWNWNVDTGNEKVLAYPEVSVGYKPWDAPGHGTASLSTRILNLKAFDVSHDLSISGSTDRFNVSYDLWLTNKPLGDEYTITTELMIWAHKGGPGGFEDAFHDGVYKSDGVTFDIVRYENFGDPSGGTSTAWRYIALVPRTDILDATIDVQDILANLVGRGLVSEKDYLTGYELGAEITGGTGGLTINDMSFDISRYGASNKANTLVGTSGRDRIYGLGGTDTISGKGGNDFISGGAQQDRLSGGSGKDTFYFNDLGKKADVITDFTHGKDTIALDSETFTSLAIGDLPESAFKIGSAFDVDTRILYDSKSGKVYYDADGSGTSAAAHVVVVLENHASLTYSDFDVL